MTDVCTLKLQDHLLVDSDGFYFENVDVLLHQALESQLWEQVLLCVLNYNQVTVMHYGPFLTLCFQINATVAIPTCLK